MFRLRQRPHMHVQAKGFTLIELLLVLFGLILLTQFAFYTFPKTTEVDQVENDLNKLADVISISQQYAITHQSQVMLTIYQSDGRYESIDFITKRKVASGKQLTKIRQLSGGERLQIKMTSNGSFSKSASYYFDTPVGKYRFVLLLGQGRFYYEKI